MVKIKFLYILFLICLTLGCANTNLKPDSSNANLIKIGTTNSIIKNWVENIGKDYVTVKSIVPDGVNPHDFQPGAKDIANFVESDIIFSIGLNYEDEWLDKILNNNSNLQNFYLGDFISPIKAYPSNHEDETHQDYDTNPDPHFWFDPLRVISVVEIISLELSKIDPDRSEYYKTESAKYITDLKDLDKYIELQLEKIIEEEKGILIDHASLGYLSDRYGVKLFEPIVSNPQGHGSPSPLEITDAVKIIKENNINIIFIGKESDSNHAQTVASESNILIADSPLLIESLDKEKTYIDFLKHNINVIVRNLINNTG